MNPIPNHLGDPRLLPACEVQNLQGCKVMEGHCQLDAERKVVSVFPSSGEVDDLDGELFLSIGGGRLRLHDVSRAEGSGAHVRYDGSIGEEPPEQPL